MHSQVSSGFPGEGGYSACLFSGCLSGRGLSALCIQLHPVLCGPFRPNRDSLFSQIFLGFFFLSFFLRQGLM